MNITHLSLDAFSLILGGLIGAIISFWFNHYLQRPKLVNDGGGSGGGPGPGHHTNYIRITNRPGLFGLKLRKTVIFGKSIHGHLEKGVNFDRYPARDCVASLVDIETKERIPLWWRLTGNGARMERIITLNSGEHADLMLFARIHDEPSEYFVFEPESGSGINPIIPAKENRFNKTKKFKIEVQYSGGKSVLKRDAEMIRLYNGGLSFRSKSSGGSF